MGQRLAWALGLAALGAVALALATAPGVVRLGTGAAGTVAAGTVAAGTATAEAMPADYYDNQVYDALLSAMAPGSAAAPLINRADRAARASRYRLFVTEVDRPSAP